MQNRGAPLPRAFYSSRCDYFFNSFSAWSAMRVAPSSRIRDFPASLSSLRSGFPFIPSAIASIRASELSSDCSRIVARPTFASVLALIICSFRTEIGRGIKIE